MLQTYQITRKHREDASFALSRPQFPCHDPRLRFLPRYSTATFAFVPLSGDQDEDELELTSGNEGATDATTLTDYLNALPDAPSTESFSSDWTPSDSEFSSDYDWTFEKFEERNARRRRARLERLDDQTLHSHYSGNSTCTDEECWDAKETELLAHQDSPKLCVLVIAPPHRIAVALQSAVCHRLACGISQPVVGLVIAPDSPTVQLAVAWPERIDTIDGGLVSPFNNQARGLTDIVHSLTCISRSQLQAQVALLWHTTYATRSLHCCWQHRC